MPASPCSGQACGEGPKFHDPHSSFLFRGAAETEHVMFEQCRVFFGF
jgi:hypothetical protein